MGKICTERLTQASSMVFGTGAFVVVKRAPAARNDASDAHMRDALSRWYRQQRSSWWIGPRPPNRTFGRAGGDNQQSV
jgi:hypothetical protein